MAFFNKKQPKQQEKKAAVQPAVRETSVQTPPKGSAAKSGDTHVLIAPYLTEKSSTLAGRGQYTFVVHQDAEKIQIARAITQQYGVTPVRVHTIRAAGKHMRYGKQSGWRSGIKKAIVTLRKGDTIPFGVRT